MHIFTQIGHQSRRAMVRLIIALNQMVSLSMLGTAILLALFIIISFMQGAFIFVDHLDQYLDFANSAKPPQSNGLLHMMAFMVVMVKAYRIVISYAKTQHVNLKYLIEIAVIAPTIEILFNATVYSVVEEILMMAFALSNLLIYVIFYDKISEMEENQVHKKEL